MPLRLARLGRAGPALLLVLAVSCGGSDSGDEGAAKGEGK